MRITAEELIECITEMTDAQRSRLHLAMGRPDARPAGVAEAMVANINMLRVPEAERPLPPGVVRVPGHVERLVPSYFKPSGGFAHPDTDDLEAARSMLVDAPPEATPEPDPSRLDPRWLLAEARRIHGASMAAAAKAEAPAESVRAAIVRQLREQERRIDSAVTAASPGADARAKLEARWLRAIDRWATAFGEPNIPRRVTVPGSWVHDVEKIEAMLYDKESRGIDPPRCACGCGAVIGCLASREEGGR